MQRAVLHSCYLLSIVLNSITPASTFIDFDGHIKNQRTLERSIVSHLTEDDALFLTPYIEKGQIDKGQMLAKVEPMLRNVESFSGYLTVNKSASSNLFFWLFKSQQGDWEKQPLVLWLQGGPGSSSLFGLLTELGPFYVTKKQKLKRRRYSWNQNFNLLFIDNPVGAGFSFTKDDSAYARTESDVARDLYEALVQLHNLFPVLQKNKLFIAGESYAGKYIPAIGYKIYKENRSSSFKLNLAGLMIGNGFTDPIDMINYASFAYKIGLIDKQMRENLTQMEDDIRATLRAGESVYAERKLDNELEIIRKAAGLKDLIDFTRDDVEKDGRELAFINDPITRKAIHVGSYDFNDSFKPYMFLKKDIMVSVKPWVEELLTAEEFPIMFYNGQLDILVAYVLSVDFFNTLQWPRANQYYNASRCQFRVGEDVAGYFKTAGTFTEVLVRNSGHAVPIAQPKWACELLNRFITNSSSFKC